MKLKIDGEEYEMETKHTPGPWRALFSSTHNVWEVRGPKHKEDGSSLLIAEIGQVNDVKDNARLIAAAPCMLKTLKHLVEMHETHRLTPLAFAHARAAIAKAEGRK